MSDTQLKMIAVLVTCHNRKALTVAAIAALPNAINGAADYQVFLADDGSTDGTSAAVLEVCPDAVIVKGDGNLYWNLGMRLAWQTAVPFKPNFFLWLNDDLELRPNSLSEMLDLYTAQAKRSIIVGKTVDPLKKTTTYGGYKIVKGKSKLRFRHLQPGETKCDTMNGNCVLFPFAAAIEVGINDPVYSHAFGDNDYGLRATRAGYTILELQTPVGEQAANEAYKEKTSRLNLKNWRYIFLHPKGVPIREWYHFCKVHGGFVWPANFIYRYLKMAFKA